MRKMTPQQLKNSILQMAMQGKLVEQRPEEGTGEALYQEIQAEKKKLIQAGKIKKSKKLPEITEEEIPFEIPESWKWVKLGNIVSIYGGKRIPAGTKLSKIDTGYKYIRVSDMKNGSVNLDNIQYVPEEVYPKIKKYFITVNDVYITVAGTIGRSGIIPPELDHANLTENADKLVFDKLDKYFLNTVIESPLIQDQIKEATTKVGQPKLAIMRIQKFIVPLPPLSEQRRIVAKLEEIQPLLDRYEKAYNRLEAYNQKFPENLKKSILQYAIEGKLVEQRSEEGTGEALYQEIQAEKKKLIQAGKIKKSKKLPEITEEEIPFEIPESWKWAKFGEIVDFFIGKTPKRHESQYWQKSEFPWVSISDLIDRGHIQRTKENISSQAAEKVFKNRFAPKGTLLMSFKLTIGKVSILDIDAFHNEAIISIFPIIERDNIFRDYLFDFLPLISAEGKTKSAIKGKTLNSNSLKNLLVPIPPLEEQKRIVAKVEELMPMVEALESEI